MSGTLHSFYLHVPNCTHDLYLQYDLCQLFHLSESYCQVHKPRNSDSSFSPAHSHSPIHIPIPIFLMYFPSHLLQLSLSGLPFNPLCIAVTVTSSESTCEHGPLPLKFFQSFGIPHMTDKVFLLLSPMSVLASVCVTDPLTVYFTTEQVFF